MKVLHAAVSMNPSLGVVRQMEWEQQSADALGLPWRTVLYTPEDIASPIVIRCCDQRRGRLSQYLALRKEYSNWIKSVEPEWDVILLRHSVHDLFELNLLHHFSHKILTVHHTLEDIEFMSVPSFSGFVLSKFETIIGNAILRRVKGNICVTREIADHELKRVGRTEGDVPVFIYPNGIEPSILEPADMRSDVPELLFVASFFSAWQGLDLLLDALDKNKTECKIHIVGRIPDELQGRCHEEKRVVLHGSLGQDGIRSLASRSWCGFSSLALFRKAMADACTLKVREYLDLGLPVYADHHDAGLPDSFAYFRQGPVDLELILKFAFECLSVKKNDVKNAALTFINKRTLVAQLYQQMSLTFPEMHRKPHV